MKNDIELKCVDCEVYFLWEVGAQEFMQKLCDEGKLDTVDNVTGATIKGTVKTPKRCPDCKAKKKAKYPQQNQNR